ncbi:hypothetical protein ASG41_18655 [Modestobacter sp. Leaf380]|nr:hypothetical protein ASG41_18655 [Modestobacter sp. Leaf380]
MDTLVLPGPDERHRIVHELVPGPVLELGDDSLVARFTRGAVETPDAAAFTDGGAQLTHRELDERSGVLARLLTRAGVGHGTTVGVHLPPGLELPVAVLAVWKVGGTYVPLDVQHPTARTAHLLADAGVGTVLTTADLAAALPAGPSLLLLDDLPVDQGAHSAAQPPLATPDDVVAVIYTSGSTGAPKGVEITARAVVNRVGWFAAQCPAAPGDVACMKTPIAFVDSLAELLGGVLQGIPTVVVGTDQGRDPCALVDVLARGGVTRFLLVPTLLRALLAHVEDLGSALPALRLWVCSGEPLPGDLAQQFAAQLPGRSLHNLYGSAEAWDSSWSPSWSSSSSSSSEVPIGSPLANVELHVLDGAGQPAPVGARGHLHVGGACLARGYRGRPDLTAERFVPHPYLPGARLYRTGDRARLLPDGQVQLAGRVDHQLKVRGSRVEPGEVERALEAVPAVRQAAVVPWRRGGTGGTELAAFVVTDGSVTAAQVRTAARAALPAHLVPSSITVVDDLPSTVTGKLDRSALPAPVEAAREPVGEPGSALEQRLAELWAQVLGVDVVGVHEDFFDLGGHSLLAAQLADLVGRSTVSRVPVSAVFEHPTVHRLAVLLEGRADGTDGDRPC